MKDKLLYDFCKRLPKIELHAHLSGSIRGRTLIELADERNVKLPEDFLLAYKSEQEEEVFFVSSSMKRSLSDCFRLFAFIPQCVNDLEALRRITVEVLEDAASDHVSYIELRTGPKALLLDSSNKKAGRDESGASSATRCSKKQYITTIVSIMEVFEQNK